MTIINGIEYPGKLLALLKPGNVLRAYPKRPFSKEVLHILAIVEEDRLVVKTWWKHHQRWHYRVVWFYELKLAYRDGNLEFVKKEKL